MHPAGPAARADPGENAVRVNDIRFRVTTFTVSCTLFTVKHNRPEATMPSRPQPPAGDDPLWFSPPDGPDSRRRALTRERVVAEALTVISTDGAAALSMRALAARLGGIDAAVSRQRQPR